MNQEEQKKSIDPKRRYNYLLIAIFVSAVVATLLVGVLLYFRLRNSLGSFAASQIADEARTTAETFSEQLFTEVENLDFIASCVEQDTGHTVDIIESIQKNDPDVTYCLVQADKEPVFGRTLSDSDYSKLTEAFRGHGTLTYSLEEGLIAAVPVMHDSNVRYVLFEIIPQELVSKRIAFSHEPLLEKSMITDKSGSFVLPFASMTPEEAVFLSSEEARLHTGDLRRQLEVSSSTCSYFKTSVGEMFIYEAEIPGTDFVLTGYSAETDSVMNIRQILTLVMCVFIALAVLFVASILYMIRVHSRILLVDVASRERKRVEDDSRTKSSFLASMSHEIRTPINAVLGINEMILREFDDQKLTGYAMNIKEAGNTLLNIINDVLDYSKMETGKLSIVPVDYDLSLMINELVTMVRPRAAAKGLNLIVNVNEKMPHLLHGDSVRVKQCALNILTNAVKYTERGKIVFTVDYTDEGDGRIELSFSVQDTGIGIRQEDMGKLFMPFERLDEVKNHGVEGTGLGLSITKMLLSMMDSRLSVESIYGEGSTFTFKVNQFVLDTEPIGNFRKSFEKQVENAPVYHQSFTAPDAKILVVDDTDMNLFVVSGLLKETKIKVDTATSGEQGLAMLRVDDYDLILIDHKMPVMDGIEMLHRLRRESTSPNQHKPCVALTANAMSGAREFYLKEGFEDYLSKPIDSVMLEQVMMTHLPKTKIHTEKMPEIPDPVLLKAVQMMRDRQNHFGNA